MRDEKSQQDVLKTELAFANLSRANLRETDLRYANLYESNLKDADLTGAKLQGTTTRVRAVVAPNDESKRRQSGSPRTHGPLAPIKRLQQASSLEGATMPNGQKYEDWLKDREGRVEDGK